MIVKLLSYNIHKGFSAFDRRFILSAIKQAIRESGADIAFLQEVVGDHTRHRSLVPEWPTTSQLEYLADEMWSHYAYGKNAVYDGGHHGNAILSRVPIIRTRNVDISVSRHERRGLLQAVVEMAPGAELYCFCTHLELFREGRSKQFSRVCSEVAGEVRRKDAPSRPFVIAGDFNDWDMRACSTLSNELYAKDVGRTRCGKLLKTFPSFFPLLALDRIYTSGLQVTAVRVLRGRPWNRLSDHAPVYAEVHYGDDFQSPCEEG